MLDIPAQLARNDLTLANEPLGQGGQANVWRIEEYPRYLFKEYAMDLDVDGALLDDLVACRSDMTEQDRALLDAATAWPIATVVDGDRTAGVIIAEAPDRFLLEGDTQKKPAELQYLVLRDRAGQLGVEVPPPFVRLQITAQLAAVLDLFARYEIVHGDISHRNVLWSSEPDPAVFVLDCDGASLQGNASPLPVVTTPHWTDPRVVDTTIEQPDVDSDRLGLALTFYRTFYQRAGNFTDGQIDIDVPDEPTVPDSVRELCREGLKMTTPRTSAEQWLALSTIEASEVGEDPEPGEAAPGLAGPNRFEFAEEPPRRQTAPVSSVEGLAVDLLPSEAPAPKAAPSAPVETTVQTASVTTPASASLGPLGGNQTRTTGETMTVTDQAPTTVAPTTVAPTQPIEQPLQATAATTSNENVPAYLVLTVFLGCLALGGVIGFVLSRFVF